MGGGAGQAGSGGDGLDVLVGVHGWIETVGLMWNSSLCKWTKTAWTKIETDAFQPFKNAKFDLLVERM
jgi:hypothetical protein